MQIKRSTGFGNNYSEIRNSIEEAISEQLQSTHGYGGIAEEAHEKCSHIADGIGELFALLVKKGVLDLDDINRALGMGMEEVEDETNQ